MGEKTNMLRSLTEQARQVYLNEFFQWMQQKMKVPVTWKVGLLHVDVDVYGKNPSVK